MHRRLSLSLLILAALACGRDRRAASDTTRDAARAEAARGPDPILLRLPRAGGTVRAYLYPRLDSVVWTGRTTSVGRILGFDPEGGSLAIMDAKGRPARVDLRLGDYSFAYKATLASLKAPNGIEIYGVDPKGRVMRLSRGSDWTLDTPYPARAVFPQSDGSLVIAAQHGAQAVLWLVHPPDTRIRDTVSLPISMRAVTAQVGDRVYLSTDTALVGVRARDLSEVPSIRVHGHITALSPTPSGDRIYVAIADDSSLAVVDRYTDKVATSVQLPGDVAELRMDALGRYVIARPVRGDSAWVIAVATNRVVGTVRTKWTDDLPATAPDGAIALNTGRDVIFVDGETLQPVRTIAGGASDFWYFTFWNGFRPRAAGMDQPVSFAVPDSAQRDSMSASDSTARSADTGAAAAPRTALPAPPPLQASRAKVAPPGSAPAAATASAPSTPGAQVASPPVTTQFTVSFAALLNEAKAHALADSIQVNGAHARVVPSQRAGTTIYRVVMGPYSSHAAADDIGRGSRRLYWVFQGQP